MANIVAVVGRPNVGKSTFFNRMIGQKKAIMDDESGITRDRHYGYADWGGKHFSIIDTGGYVLGNDDTFNQSIREQVELAVEEADVVLFMVDCSTGITDSDKDFANVLRRSNKPVMLIANKADDSNKAHMAAEFYALGFDNLYPVSSQNGSGTGDMLDELIKHFKDDGIENPDEGIPRIAILGRPNAGKSSLVNLLLGKDRTIVSEVAGTTRDSVHSKYKMFEKEFILVDTAGLRKKSKVKENVEFYSVLRAIRALEESDVVIVMIDAQNGVEAQDLNILRLAQQNKKGVMILVNKWDLIEKDHKTAKEFEEKIKSRIAPHDYIPIFFVSVTNKQRIFKSVEKAIEIYENKSMKVPTSQLNDKLLPEIERTPPPSVRGQYIRIKYITQLPSNSITFAFFCNFPQYIKQPYERFLENKIRDHFGFDGVPIKIVFRKK